MACCSSTKIPKLQQELSKTNFDDIFLKIGTSRLKFNIEDGLFKQIQNDDANYLRRNEVMPSKTLNEEANLRNEINQKNEKLKLLKGKIKEIDSKIETMYKILSVDVKERQFVYETRKSIDMRKETAPNNFVN